MFCWVEKEKGKKEFDGINMTQGGKQTNKQTNKQETKETNKIPVQLDS